ncbi:MAG TPA: hypothetical protein P5267_00265 [Patescibacteria group bacterium]|nr:hypothetical protein [Patescibacteria group bacterium]
MFRKKYFLPLRATTHNTSQPFVKMTSVVEYIYDQRIHTLQKIR